MPKKKFKGDIEVYNPGTKKGVFPDPSIPMPKAMTVKPYRKDDLKKTYGDRSGDMQVVIKKQNPRPKEVKILNYSEKQKLVKKMLENPRKYAKLS